MLNCLKTGFMFGLSLWLTLGNGFTQNSPQTFEEIINDYLSKYPSTSVTGPDFQTHRWSSLLNWSSIQEYWRDVRSLPCPSFEEFSLQRGVKELDAEIDKLTSL